MCSESYFYKIQGAASESSLEIEGKGRRRRRKCESESGGLGKSRSNQDLNTHVVFFLGPDDVLERALPDVGLDAPRGEFVALREHLLDLLESAALGLREAEEHVDSCGRGLSGLVYTCACREGRREERMDELTCGGAEGREDEVRLVADVLKRRRYRPSREQHAPSAIRRRIYGSE